eukprot:TRINITY_DN4493_c0_g2_i2.p1 TRINITY_DN4493_c0_g2~~TRINITY_DN4493_c0_g2_i2.p1  ORF type:complete len:276 (-),score=-65.82 TRINITY_DN4493_c0_g2_i2:91-873(-)
MCIRDSLLTPSSTRLSIFPLTCLWNGLGAYRTICHSPFPEAFHSVCISPSTCSSASPFFRIYLCGLHGSRICGGGVNGFFDDEIEQESIEGSCTCWPYFIILSCTNVHIHYICSTYRISVAHVFFLYRSLELLSVTLITGVFNGDGFACDFFACHSFQCLSGLFISAVCLNSPGKLRCMRIQSSLRTPCFHRTFRISLADRFLCRVRCAVRRRSGPFDAPLPRSFPVTLTLIILFACILSYSNSCAHHPNASIPLTLSTS